MLQAQKNRYLDNSVQTASPAQLLIMLYDGAIRFSKAAILAIKEGKNEDAHRNLVKVQDIVAEFEITLDRNSEVAEGLLKLYEYFKTRLREANLKKDVVPVEEVLGYLTELRETWIAAAKPVASVQRSS
ncbi:flagellar export chaperone FliS [Paenibacillus lignilyticus]|uniref:Flagellar secretion chaperone FliS n=1 Tax=Paenibacillus lignilyticus TaxID=1172615 RepID=A0ABS5CLS5_9BACL|nr:flagellar export chaperone FliS [Paenibacillus lignilyticus]MBP3966775.1 flagellar export chaperone FliS [Paenibacillus lignilyticus]